MNYVLQKLALDIHVLKSYHPHKGVCSLWIIKELYKGLINPMEDFGCSTDQIYLDLVADTQKIEEGLLSGLDEKEQKVYQTISQSRVELQRMEFERMFDYAFRMGSRFGAEIFKEE